MKRILRSAALSLLLLLIGPAMARAQSVGPIAVADHIALSTIDADASAAFYKALFGLTDVPTRLPKTRWLRMGNGMTLHLIGGRTATLQPDRIAHFALRTHDLNTVIAHLDKNETPWFDFLGKPRNIQTRFDGVRQIFIQDPDGYWIEISDIKGKAPD